MIRLLARARVHGKGAERRIDAVARMLDERGAGDAVHRRPVDAFKLFKLDQKFSISESRLKAEMVKLQRMLHPDRFFDEDRDSRAKSDYLSALVNDSYETLRQPYKRAKYLLSLATGRTQDQIERQLDRLKMDSAFLAEQMALRERIDSPMDRLEASKMAAALASEIDALNSQLDADFGRADFDAILAKLGKLKFLANCYASLEAKSGGLFE